MKKLTLITAVFCLLALPAAFSMAAVEACQVDVATHGTVRFVNVEGGCWQFQADDGAHYELITDLRNILKDGLTGTLYGDIMSLNTFCQVGTPVEVCDFEADHGKHGAGTLVFSPCLEGGCWIYTIGNTSYSPFSQDPDFYQHEALIRAEFLVRDDMASICMVGPVIEILNFTVIKEGVETPDCGSLPLE